MGVAGGAAGDRTRAFDGFRSPLLLASGLVLVLVAVVYGPLFFPSKVGSIASEGDQFFFEVNQAAGAPVLILALWLFYRRIRRRDVLNGPGAPARGGLVLAGATAIYAWGVWTGAPDLQLVSGIVFLFGLLLMWGGGAAVRAYWVPALFLAFALPLSPVLVSVVIWPLQLATASYAGALLNLIGVESFVQGDQILRPENTFVVIESCSGLRSVVTLSMLTVLLIDLFERRGWHAMVLMLLAPVVALLTNGVRVVTLVLNPQSDVASVHSLQGIGMLLVGLTLIYLADGLIERMRGGADAAEPDYGDVRPPAPSTPGRLAALAVPVFVLLICLATRSFVSPWSAVRPLEKPVDAMVAEALGDWPSSVVTPDYLFRGGLHFRSWSRRMVEVDGGRVDVLVGLANPTNRKLSVLSPRLPWPASGYAVVSETAEPLIEGTEDVRRMLFRRGASTVLSYSWYEPAPSLVGELFRHALALDRSPFAREQEIVAIRLASRVRNEAEVSEVEARMRRVYTRIRPTVDELGREGSRVQRERFAWK